MITENDIAAYLSHSLAAQPVETMRPKFPRWVRRLQEWGVAEVPLTLGSASARYVDLFANKESEEPSAQLIAHDIRDTMSEIRPYKGR